MKHNFAQRRKKLKKEKIGAAGGQSINSRTGSALLITNLKNVTYLSGFTGSSAYLLLTDKQDFLLSDTRYQSQLETEVTGLEIDIRDSTTTLLDSAERIAKSSRLKSILFESDALTKTEFDKLETKLAGFELVGTSGLVEKARAIKDKSEIETIRKSIGINQRAFEVIRSQLTADQTEREIAHNLEHQMRAFGAKGCAFDPIVGVGPRAALPHGHPSEKKIGESPFVLIDWGAEVDHYLSDLTRMIINSKAPAKFVKIYNVVLKAQLAAIKKIRPGATLKSVDAAARKVIADAGFGKYFGHGLGHSFGLEIHEQPFISPVAKGTLEPGMVITVEPGIYLPDFAGVRIEDDVLVTKTGHEILSNLPKQIDQCTVDL